MNWRTVLIQAAGSALLAAAHLGIAQNNCDAVKNLTLDGEEIVSAKWVEAGTTQVQVGTPPKSVTVPVKRHCEITAVSRPTTDSVINFTLWLPPLEDWNGSTSSSVAAAGPKVARYKGRGDTNLADNFECVEERATGQSAKD